MNMGMRKKIIETALQGKMILMDHPNVWHIYENHNWFSNEQYFEIIKKDAFTDAEKESYTLTIPYKNKDFAILLKNRPDEG